MYPAAIQERLQYSRYIMSHSPTSSQQSIAILHALFIEFIQHLCGNTKCKDICNTSAEVHSALWRCGQIALVLQLCSVFFLQYSMLNNDATYGKSHKT